MNYAHHVDLHRAIQAKLLGDAGDFPSRQHDAQSQQEIVLEREQAQKQQGRLEESRQAQGEDLLAPLAEPVCVAPGTLNRYRLPTAIWMSKMPPLFMLAKNTFSTQ